MWKAAVGQKITIPNQDEDDDWETDPDFVNNVTEQEQRWGSTTVQGSGRTAGAINMEQLRRETEEADVLRKKKQLEEASDNPSFGYGGKFGVEKDRMDQSAVGHEYVAKVEKHASQKDYSTGFGGKFGIQSDRIDKSAVNWDYKEKLEKHASQKDYAAGFGGKFGVQTDRQDKSAVGWDHIEKIEKHESQKDYAKGFGGKFGVQSDRIDKSAVGWDHHEAPQKHESQLDHKKGFGGKFGIQTDRFDKSAASFNNETTTPLDILNKYEAMSIEKNKNNVEKNVENNVPKKSVHAKVALFNKTADNPLPKEKPLRTSLDSSKTAFLKQTIQSDENSKITPKALDQSKIAQFNKQNNTENKINSIENGLKTKEIESVPIKDEPITTVIEPPVQKEQIYDNLQNSDTNNETETISEDVEYYSQDEIVDTGVSAVALFDYQAAADDEISFDPDDIITHIEKIDEGWWRGLCKGMYGLFPANYVQIQE